MSQDWRPRDSGGPMSQTLFRQFAAYNAWANVRLYAAALDLPHEAYRRQVGVFFGSLHGTLNHLLTADLIWLHRLTGDGPAPLRLDGILYPELPDLARARLDQDARLEALVASYADADLARPLAYRTLAGQSHEQPLGDILLHLFNHQTHHRGQAHACCSLLTGAEPPSLDLLQFQRGVPAPDLASRLG